MDNFVTVTKEQFYDIIFKKNLNVHPFSERMLTNWIMQDGSRETIGITTPGYLHEGEKTYKITSKLTK